MAEVRLATFDDVESVVATFAAGFADDPVWGHWTFPEARDRVERLRTFWTPFVRASVKYDGAYLIGDSAAVALWVPPDTPDLDAEDEAAVAAMLPVVCGDRAELVEAGFECFAATRPSASHWYLSLLATRPDHAGSGLGMALVADRLLHLDTEHATAYLESTNPGNVARYRRAGFEPAGSFTLPQGPVVDQMVRAPR
jgi:GNAT superfamily N-acetyltransferase